MTINCRVVDELTVLLFGGFLLLLLLLLSELDPFGSLLGPSEDVETVFGVGL